MNREIYNTQKLDEIAQGDENFVYDMVVTFFENATTEIENILSYQSVENWKSIAEAAHKLASNFAYLNAHSLHHLAADIEKSILYEHNLAGITEKIDQLCQEGMILVHQVKKDFCIPNTN